MKMTKELQEYFNKHLHVTVGGPTGPPLIPVEYKLYYFVRKLLKTSPRPYEF